MKLVMTAIILTAIAANADPMDNLSRKQVFCGANLTKVISTFCDSVFSPFKHREKRQIVIECCRQPCSIKHMIDNYCSKINRTAVENYNKEDVDMLREKQKRLNFISQDASHSSIEPLDSNNDSQIQQVRKRRYRQRSLVNASGESYQIINKFNKKARGKRNCTCRRRRDKKANRIRQKFLALSNVIRSSPPLQANVGKIEESQPPFYVKLGRR